MASLLARWPKRPSPPARQPPPRASARVHARGRARRDAVACRQNSATAWRACDDLDAPWSATRSARPCPPPPPLPFAPSAPSLSLSRPRSVCAEHRRRHWSSELRLGRSPPACEPFVDSSLPELRPRLPLLDTPLSAWKRTVSPARPRFLLRREHHHRARGPRATVPSGTA